MTNYNFENQPAQIHHVGAYVSLTTAQGKDVLISSPAVLKPFHKTVTRKQKIGEISTVVDETGIEKYERPDGIIRTRTIKTGEHVDIVPQYETVRVEVIADEVTGGTPIKVGDAVGVIGIRGNPIRGTLTELTNDYALVDSDTGDGPTYYFWNVNIGIVRAKDIEPVRRNR